MVGGRGGVLINVYLNVSVSAHSINLPIKLHTNAHQIRDQVFLNYNSDYGF